MKIITRTQPHTTTHQYFKQGPKITHLKKNQSYDCCPTIYALGGKTPSVDLQILASKTITHPKFAILIHVLLH